MANKVNMTYNKERKSSKQNNKERTTKKGNVSTYKMMLGKISGRRRNVT